jgi:hypothetical protein
VTEGTVADAKPGAAGSNATGKGKTVAPQPGSADLPKVVGQGWASVLVVAMPAADTKADAGGSTGGAADKSLAQLTKIVGLLPKVSGSWGSGRLMAGTAFSALLTDDGRLVIGAVTPEGLYAALAAK